MYAADELYDTAELEDALSVDVKDRPCSTCGATETIEITTEGPPEMSINVCAVCGSDE